MSYNSTIIGIFYYNFLSLFLAGIAAYKKMFYHEQKKGYNTDSR